VSAGEEDTYLDAVVKETMRLCPGAPIVVRKLLAPMELGGYTIPPAQPWRRTCTWCTAARTSIRGQASYPRNAIAFVPHRHALVVVTPRVMPARRTRVQRLLVDNDALPDVSPRSVAADSAHGLDDESKGHPGHTKSYILVH
jgi:hypothetical protein